MQASIAIGKEKAGKTNLLGLSAGGGWVRDGRTPFLHLGDDGHRDGPPPGGIRPSDGRRQGAGHHPVDGRHPRGEVQRGNLTMGGGGAGARVRMGEKSALRGRTPLPPLVGNSTPTDPWILDHHTGGGRGGRGGSCPPASEAVKRDEKGTTQFARKEK